jgi:beta-glucosidase
VKTDMGWSIDPRGLTELLLRVAAEKPGLPLMVTENGAAFPDEVGEDGRILDADRIEYLREHLGAVHRAIAEGAPVTGYYVWSLLDNFEWSWGYAKRFGIVHVDYSTLERTPKGSALFYADVIRGNAVPV